MAKETINNGEGGLSVRGKLNNMFTELYNNLFGGGVTEAWVNSQIDSKVAGLLDYRGAYDASGDAFPSSGGSGDGGAVLKGDMWVVSVAGTLGGNNIQVGDFVIAETDTPGQTAANWSSLNTNISYVPENAGNKENTTLDESVTKYPTNRLIKEYVDANVGGGGVTEAWVNTQIDSKVAGLLDYRGAYDASGDAFPSSGGSGDGGAVLKGDMWVVSVAGTLGGNNIQVGDFVIAETDTPGQTAANWSSLNTNISYVPENAGNKENTTLDESVTKYPTNRLIKEYVDANVGGGGVTEAWVNTQIDSKVAGLLDYRGAYDASGDAFPSSGGSGDGGAVLKGDMWVVSVAGTLGGNNIQVGDFVIAETDAPAQVAANWSSLNTNISYVPENAGNKENITLDESVNRYPTNRLVKEYADAIAYDAGDVFKTGTPSSYQIAVWSGEDYVRGMDNITINGNVVTFKEGAQVYLGLPSARMAFLDAYVSGVLSLLSGHSSRIGYISPGNNINHISIASDMVVLDSINNKGLVYAGVYFSDGSQDDRWIPDWRAVKDHIGGKNVHPLIKAPTVTENGRVIAWNNTNEEYELVANGAGSGGNVSSSGTPADNDFARFTDATHIEGRSAAETREDLGLVLGQDVQPWDENNATIGTLLDDFGEPEDNTDLDATSGRHGLLPKLSGNEHHCLKGDGGFADITRIPNLPTSDSGLSTGDLFTQTMSELGGSGTRKVLCVA